jgi:hypothetical protein
MTIEPAPLLGAFFPRVRIPKAVDAKYSLTPRARAGPSHGNVNESHIRDFPVLEAQ